MRTAQIPQEAAYPQCVGPHFSAPVLGGAVQPRPKMTVEPTNIAFPPPGTFNKESTPAGHLLLFPANLLPHGRPDLSTLPKHAPPYRYFLRMYAEPNWRRGETLPSALQFGEQQAYNGLVLPGYKPPEPVTVG